MDRVIKDLSNNGIFVAATVTPEVSVSIIKPQEMPKQEQFLITVSVYKRHHDVADVLVLMKILCVL